MVQDLWRLVVRGDGVDMLHPCRQEEATIILARVAGVSRLLIFGGHFCAEVDCLHQVD